MTPVLRKACLAAILLAAMASTSSANAQQWTYFGMDIDNRIRAVTVDGSDMYVGGDFTTITADDAMSRIARWDGTQWHALGQGVDNRVYGIVVVGSNVYVTGRVTEAYNSDGTAVAVAGVARWDGTEWHALGTGLEGPSATLGFAMVAGGGIVYVGGSLTAAGGNAVNNIAAWDDAAQSWSAVGGGFTDVVRTLAYDDATDALYAGGSFDVVTDGDQFNFIAMWDGFRWNALGDGLNDTGRTITLTDSYVYVGGGSGTIPVMARWDGQSWEDLSAGFDDRVDAIIATSDDVLYASGDFTTAGGVAAAGLAQFDAGAWSALGSGLDDKAISMKLLNGDVVIGGEFSTVNGEASSSLVVYTPAGATAVDADDVPGTFVLEQNYPNPFNPATTISYAVDAPGMVELQVFDLMGRNIATLQNAPQAAGQYTVRYDAQGLPSGTYIYRLRTGDRAITRAMLLSK